MPTARFSDLLALGGAPRVHLAWTAPARDRVLQDAARRHRLLTLIQNARGQKKDHGLVGLHPGRNVQYLLFPRSLRRFAGRRIVGIDYRAIAGDALAPAAPASTTAAAGIRPKPRRARPAAPAKPRAEVVTFPSPASPHPAATSPARSTPQRPVTPARTQPAPVSEPRTPAPAWLDAVRRAAADLKRGRAVAAYERLQRLLAQHER